MFTNLKKKISDIFYKFHKANLVNAQMIDSITCDNTFQKEL